MSYITRNLPWFIRDLGVAIVGQKCYTSLIENLNIGDVECVKYSLSKGLGIGIVVGGSIMKVPQIFLIVNARSARGLSLPSYILETLSYAITLVYSFRHQYPFSTYGENLFLTIQNVVITLLIIYYAPSHLLTRQQVGKTQKVVTAFLFTAAACFALGKISLDTLALLQIRQNFRSQSTGQLSAFAVISQIAGCLARLFTTATEVGDTIVSAGFALALLLNIILGTQLWLYWGQLDDTKDELEMDHIYINKKPTNDVPLWQSQTLPPSVYAPSAAPPLGSTTNRISTPPPRAPSTTGTRKWARKVD